MYPKNSFPVKHKEAPTFSLLKSQRSFPLTNSDTNQINCVHYTGLGITEQLYRKHFQSKTTSWFILQMKSLFLRRGCLCWRGAFFRPQSKLFNRASWEMENCDALSRTVCDRSENSMITLNVTVWFIRHRETVPTHHKQTHLCPASQQIHYKVFEIWWT